MKNVPVNLIGGSRHQQVCIVGLVRQVPAKFRDASAEVSTKFGMEGYRAIRTQENHLRVVF
jgi:hypothetical protein